MAKLIYAALASLDGFVAPIVVGGGDPFVPGDVRVELDLLDELRFDSGMNYLRYGKRASTCGLALMPAEEVPIDGNPIRGAR